MAQLKISIKMAAAATISSTNWKIFTLNFCCKVCVASEMTDSVVEAVELALSAAFWAAAKASLAASLFGAPYRLQLTPADFSNDYPQILSLIHI